VIGDGEADHLPGEAVDHGGQNAHPDHVLM
jgi:hypothetical protein